MNRKSMLLLSIILYLSLVVSMVVLGISEAYNEFIYPLDDTYIHMAIAKNFAEHGVWGVTQYEFTSSTSAPLWTFLLALIYMISGVSIIAPLLTNVIVGIIFIIYLHYRFKYEFELWSTFLFTALIILVTSLPSLSLVGMEHTLHVFLVILFVNVSVQNITGSDKDGRFNWSLLLLAAALPLVRYEGLFTVAIIIFVFAANGRFKEPFRIAIAALIPITIYGLISIYNGWYFFPNSILLKGSIPDFGSIKEILKMLGAKSIVALSSHTVLLILAASSIAVFFKNRNNKHTTITKEQWSVVIFLLHLFLHLQYAQTGWLFRYEGYLVALGLVAVLPSLPKLFNRLSEVTKPLVISRLPVIIIFVCSFALIFPFGKRAANSLAETKDAMFDRYLEHIQPARFVEEYYKNSTVAVNDIGAITFFTDNPVYDIFGLGNIEPLNMKMKNGNYTSVHVQEEAEIKNTEIAILQIEWKAVNTIIPPKWLKVVEWNLPRNVVFGDTLIGFFATDTSNAAILKNRMKEFSSKLPSEIDLRYIE